MSAINSQVFLQITLFASAVAFSWHWEAMQEKCPLLYTLKFFLNSTSFLYTNSIDGKDAIAEITKKKIGWYNE